MPIKEVKGWESVMGGKVWGPFVHLTLKHVNIFTVLIFEDFLQFFK